MTLFARGALAGAILAAPAALGAQSFVVTDTSVRQGRFEAVARTREMIVSSYPRAAREVRFHFSIDGAEMRAVSYGTSTCSNSLRTIVSDVISSASAS